MLAMYIFMIVLNFDYLLIALHFATHNIFNNTIINNYHHCFIMIFLSYIYIYVKMFCMSFVLTV